MESDLIHSSLFISNFDKGEQIMRKTGIRIVSFIIIFCFLIGYVNHVLSVKSGGIYRTQKFYELEDNTVDVLVLGSSHAFANINTAVLWKEYGIASYILGGSSQPMWNTYFYLKEALKTQTPKLIVLEGYRVVEEAEYVMDSFIITNTYGLKWSRNKIDAIRTSVPEERQMAFLLGYTQYHNRYTELSEEDFLRDRGSKMYENWKGSQILMKTTPLEVPNIGDDIADIKLTEKTEKYYRAIIELAQEKEIPIMIVISPYGGIVPDDQALFQTAEKIAGEYGVPFVNYNDRSDLLRINYETDLAEESHLNYRGGYKLSKALGEYMVSHYDISDHRGETIYTSWEDDSQYLYALMTNQQMKEMTDVDEIQEYIQEQNYDVFLSIDGYGSADNETSGKFLDRMGIVDLGYGGGIWYLKNGREHIWKSGDGEAVWFFETQHNDFGVKRTRLEDGSYKNEIIIDNQIYKTVQNGVNVVVFDQTAGEVVDSFGLDADDVYKLKR